MPDHKSQHTADSTHIHSLPPEILSQVFLRVVDVTEDGRIAAQSQFSSAEQPSNSTGSYLGSVCTYWRNISLNTPALWATLLVVIGCQSYPARTLERFRTHLERSTSFPLAVTLTIGDGFSVRDYRDMLTAIVESTEEPTPAALFVQFQLLELTLGAAERIRDFSLFVYGHGNSASTFAISLLSYFQNRFSILHHATFSVRDTKRCLDVLSGSPFIRSLRFVFPIDESTNLSVFPFSQITNITFIYSFVDTVWTVLTLCPNIQSAHFHLCHRHGAPPIRLKLSFPYLHNLSIKLEDSIGLQQVADMMNSMETPALNHLSFGITRWGWKRYPVLTAHANLREYMVEVFLPAAMHLIASSSKNIHTLCMTRFLFDDRHLISMLVKTPNLVELKVKEAEREDSRVVTARLLEELTVGSIVPKLKDLRLVMYGDWGEGNVFENLVESRIPLLRSTYLKVFNDPEAELKLDLNRLRKLQDRGLAVRVVKVHHWDRDQYEEVLGYGRDV